MTMMIRASITVPMVVTTVPERLLTEIRAVQSRQDELAGGAPRATNFLQLEPSPCLHAVRYVGEFPGKLGAEYPAGEGDESQHHQTGDQETGPDRQRRPALKRLRDDMQENRDQDRRKPQISTHPSCQISTGTSAIPIAKAA